MKKYDLVKKVQITQEDVDDLLDAGLGAISYWCDEIVIDERPTEPWAFTSEVLTRGGTFKVYVNEEEEIFTLTLDKFLQAIADEQVDFDDYDGVVADCVIQRALFGEVVYG